MIFTNANEVFIYYYKYIEKHGILLDNTKCIYNTGFTILNPLDNKITKTFRKWKNSYAELEWEWYLSQNRSVSEIKKHAKIWDKMHNGDDIVNSNYGYQWNRNNQLDFVIKELTNNPYSRRAVLTIYDGKEHTEHKYDTPCTLNIIFYINNNKLDMSVLMRSNDLWFGFCNDQYCFSKLQQLVSEKLKINIGTYYHYVTNLHLYKQHLNLNT